MSPTAMTSAGRNGAGTRGAGPARAGAARGAGARGPSASASAPATRTPRPVRAGSLSARSGGAETRASAAGGGAATARALAPRPARAAAVHAPRPVRTTPSRAPRRVSGPVRSTRPPQPLPRRAVLATLEFFRTLPDHRLVDRLVRGRSWIPVLGVLLAGIVATQVEVLKLGASMGRWMERGAALTSRNQALEASVAALSDDQRIERLAAHMGMVMPAPTSITFLSHHPAGGIRGALSKISPPNPAQFQATLQTQMTLAANSVSAPVPPTGTVATGTTSTTTSSGTTAATTSGGAASLAATGTSSQSTGG